MATASQLYLSNMAYLVLTVVILVFNLIFLCDSGRILVVVPTPSISHQVVFRPLTQELARRGHEVVVLTTDPAFPKGQSPANLTEIDVHDISYKRWINETKSYAKQKGLNNNHYKLLKVMLTILPLMYELEMNNTEFRKAIYEDGKFDLVIVEACARPAFAVPYILKTPTIAMSSFGAYVGQYNTFGAPSHPMLYPTPIRQRVYNLTLWEKVTELYNHYYMEYIVDQNELVENEVVKRVFGSDVPPISQLQNNFDMLFLNIHPIFEGNFPVPPNVIHIWGIHKKPQKELPQDLKSYLDSSKHGVIYMSFGTNVDPTLLPTEKMQLFVKVFSKLPFDVLWKWNGDELPGKPDNVKIMKWFPQSDLLKHPKVKLFITQGGLQSTDEAITANVPLIAVPMVADQWHNAEKYVHLGIGIKLSWDSITEEQIRDAIETLIQDESYRKNIEKLSKRMSDEPMSALERAVWWTEYVMRHGGARHLRSPAANISWAQYLELELVFALFLGLLVLASACIAAFSLISKYVGNYSGKAKVKVN